MKALLVALVVLFGVFAHATMTSVVSVRTTYPVSTPVTLVSSTVYPVKNVNVFDSSGQTMELIIVSGSHTDYLIIPPGGGNFTCHINTGASISLQYLSGAPSGGENDANFLY